LQFLQVVVFSPLPRLVAERTCPTLRFDGVFLWLSRRMTRQEIFNRNVTLLLLEVGKTQKDVAEELGQKPSSFRSYLTRTWTRRDDWLQRLSNALKVENPDDLYRDGFVKIVRPGYSDAVPYAAHWAAVQKADKAGYDRALAYHSFCVGQTPSYLVPDDVADATKWERHPYRVRKAKLEVISEDLAEALRSSDATDGDATWEMFFQENETLDGDRDNEEVSRAS
jgi:hypothetical protein